MNKFILMAITMVSISAHADVLALVFVNARNTEAKILINETSLDGDMSKFFDQMKIKQTGSATRQTKTFTLKNGRFGLTCNKGVFTSTPPSTSCVFIIKQGENNGDIKTVISKNGNTMSANFEVSPAISSELTGIFPADANNTVSYVLSLPKNVAFEVQGSTSGNMTIGFSAK
jgi:hypothetical protein